MPEIPIRAFLASLVAIRNTEARHEVLLLKRTQTLIGEWCQIAGSIEKYETAWQAALRELDEETGLKPSAFYSADTCEQFYGDDSYVSYLKPIEKLNSKLAERINQMKTKSFIGLHIRRGDNITSRDVSKSLDFERAIENELSIDVDAMFYLCTDDYREENNFKLKYGNRIMHFPVGLNRSRPKDIQNALLDLVMLSKSNKIYGSYWSSFSEVASAYGRVELEMVGLKARGKQ